GRAVRPRARPADPAVGRRPGALPAGREGRVRRAAEADGGRPDRLRAGRGGRAMSGLRIVSAGFAHTVLDLGARLVQPRGVPPSGAVDPVALRIASAVVGNPAGTAAIELRVMGPTIEVEAEAVRIAVAGTGAPVEIVGDRRVEAPPH